jgi:hypothetical protein
VIVVTLYHRDRPKFGIFQSHGVVNHSATEYVHAQNYTNTVEEYFSIVKRGAYGIYQQVNEAHLQRYFAGFDFRCFHWIKTGFDDMARMDKAPAGLVVGGRVCTAERTRASHIRSDSRWREFVKFTFRAPGRVASSTQICAVSDR